MTYYYLSDYQAERFPTNTKDIETRNELLKELGVFHCDDLYDPSTGGSITCWKSRWKLTPVMCNALALIIKE